MKIRDVLLALGTVVMVVGGFFVAVDSRIDNRVCRAEAEIGRKVQELENQTLMTFKEFRKDMRMERLYSRLRMLETELDELRWKLAERPGDARIRNRIEELLNEISKIKEEINRLTYGE